MGRYFACTACGKCCTRGPEMELSEATALADVFITRLMFKLHSLPLDHRSSRAALWAKREGSSLPVRKALAEARDHLRRLAVHEETDRANERLLYLTISALPVQAGQGCPALHGAACGIYARRPACCRTVPFHYSRAPSTLGAYLDAFTRTPGYACDTTDAAPAVMEPAMDRARANGLAIAAADKPWHAAIFALVRSDGAARAGLPDYATIVRNAAAGATTVSMVAAWEVARRAGIITPAQFDSTCRGQVALLRAGTARNTPEAPMFRDMLTDYEIAKASA